MHCRPTSVPMLFSSILLAAVSTTACNRTAENEAPVAQMKAETPPQAVNQPTTLTGCLRAGEAAETYVLTTSNTADGVSPTTYQLAASRGVNLASEIGKRVEVSGIITTQQRSATVSSASPAGEKPTGTGGTPVVETRTQLDIKRLEVSGIKPLGDRCDD
jgi:hypothetical protein